MQHDARRRRLLRHGVLCAAASALSRAAFAQQPAAAASAGASAGTASRPNIVFILMDNLGYGEIGCYGGGVVRGAPTPRIDKLASEGTRLTNFNVEAQCTPSRSAIMTGRFPIRSGTHSIPIGGGAEGLVQWEVTIAKLLSGVGKTLAGRLLMLDALTMEWNEVRVLRQPDCPVCAAFRR